MKPLLVFTDLDGTLLDHDTYSFDEALPGLEALRKEGIPLIFNSSKTFAELIDLAATLDLRWPMVLENGGGVAVPVGWSRGEEIRLPLVRRSEGYHLYALGRPRLDFVAEVHALRAEFDFLPYAAMEVSDVVALTGLDPESARHSLQRDFTEPCHWRDSEEAFVAFRTRVESLGLSCVRGGRFAHIMGAGDKGRALKWVAGQLFEPGARTLAAGDGENDLPMLEAADIAILVRSLHHDPPIPRRSGGVITTQRPGPAGWSGAILAELGVDA